jgi:tetratricopeptide (TPR) repeat protein
MDGSSVSPFSTWNPPDPALEGLRSRFTPPPKPANFVHPAPAAPTWATSSYAALGFAPLAPSFPMLRTPSLPSTDVPPSLPLGASLDDDAGPVERGELVARRLAEARDAFSQKDYTAAHGAFTAALELRPGDASALSNRAACAVMAGRLNDALADCAAAVEVDPLYVPALLRAARVHMQLGDLRGALSSADRAVAAADALAADAAHARVASERRAARGMVAQLKAAIEMERATFPPSPPPPGGSAGALLRPLPPQRSKSAPRGAAMEKQRAPPPLEALRRAAAAAPEAAAPAPEPRKASSGAAAAAEPQRPATAEIAPAAAPTPAPKAEVQLLEQGQRKGYAVGTLHRRAVAFGIALATDPPAPAPAPALPLAARESMAGGDPGELFLKPAPRLAAAASRGGAAPASVASSFAALSAAAAAVKGWQALLLPPAVCAPPRPAAPADAGAGDGAPLWRKAAAAGGGAGAWWAVDTGHLLPVGFRPPPGARLAGGWRVEALSDDGGGTVFLRVRGEHVECRCSTPEELAGDEGNASPQLQPQLQPRPQVPPSATLQPLPLPSGEPPRVPHLFSLIRGAALQPPPPPLEALAALTQPPVEEPPPAAPARVPPPPPVRLSPPRSRPLEKPTPPPPPAAAAYLAAAEAKAEPLLLSPPRPSHFEAALEASVALLRAINADAASRYVALSRVGPAGGGDGGGAGAAALLPFQDVYRGSLAARAEVRALSEAAACSPAVEAAAAAAVAAWGAATAAVAEKVNASSSRAELLGRMHGGGRRGGGGGGASADECADTLRVVFFAREDALPVALSVLAAAWARAKYEALELGAQVARARAIDASAQLCRAQVVLAVARMRRAREGAAAEHAALAYEALSPPQEAAVRAELAALAERAGRRDVEAGAAVMLLREAEAVEAELSAARRAGEMALSQLPRQLEAAARAREHAARTAELEAAYVRTLAAGAAAEHWAQWGRIVQLLAQRRERVLPPLRVRLRSLLAEGSSQGARTGTAADFAVKHENAFQIAALADVLRALPYAPAREERLRKLLTASSGIAQHVADP